MSRFRTLLMPLGLGGEVVERLTGALAVARHFEAHLDVMFTTVSPRHMIPSEIFGVSKDVMHGLSDAADGHVAACRDERQAIFVDLCRRFDVPIVEAPGPSGVSAAWHSVDGLRSVVLAARGRLADLIVVARPPEAKPSAMIEAALKETGRPVLMMPRTQETFAADRVVIGWNGSTESARAVDAALPCLVAAGSVRILTTDRHADEGIGATALGRYLAWHGVDADVHILDASHRSVGDALLAAAAESGADLLVVGGYSHRQRARHLILGGVTERILAAAELPVLMAH